MNNRVLGGIAVGLSVVAIACCAAALTLKGSVQWGPVGQWVSGLATTAAFAVTLYNLYLLNKNRDNDAREAAERARRRASHLSVIARPAPQNARIWRFHVENTSTKPVYDVHFRIPLAVVLSSRTVATWHFSWKTPGGLGRLPVLEPGKQDIVELRIEDSAPEFGDPDAHQVLPFVEFTDDDGYTLCLDWEPDFRGFGYRWSIKDASRYNYPKDLAGLEQHFHAAAESSPRRTDAARP